MAAIGPRTLSKPKKPPAAQPLGSGGGVAGRKVVGGGISDETKFLGSHKKVFFYEFCACPKLDVLSVPEALVHGIRILEAPAVYLKHRWLKS